MLWVSQAGQEVNCNGVKCYKLAFIIIIVATLLGCLVSFVLVLRTKIFYKGDIYKKFRKEAKETGSWMTSIEVASPQKSSWKKLLLPLLSCGCCHSKAIVSFQITSAKL